MKKLFVIVMLSIHLFNSGGYLLLQQYQIYKTDKLMNELISKNLYNPKTLIEVKVAQHLPGINETWGDYKNIDGQVQLKNACYNYVKLKVTRDTLYIMVIKNYEKTRLMKKNIIYARQVNDIPQNDKDRNASLKKPGSDLKYNHLPPAYNFTAFEVVSPVKVRPVILGTIHPFIPVAGQPPKVVS